MNASEEVVLDIDPIDRREAVVEVLEKYPDDGNPYEYLEVYNIDGKRFVLYVDMGEFVMETPYDQSAIARVKRVPGRRFDNEKRSWSFPLSSLGKFMEEFPEVPLPASLVEEHRRIVSPKEHVRDLDVIPGFHGVLYPFQRIGTEFLVTGKKVLLCDEMGLGKTIEAIAASCVMLEEGTIEKVIVFSPSDLKYQWEREVRKFTDRTTVRIVGTPKVRRRQWEEARGVDFVFLNYELAINDLDSTFIHGMLSDYRCALVLDEATRIKNFRAKRTREFSKFSAVVKILLTGTPLENRPGELYTLVSFLDNHILGSWNSFDYEYIKRNAKGWVVGYRNLAGLHDRVSPIMLRRRKQEVMPELPSKIVNEYPVEMSKEEMSDYNAIKNRVVEHVQKMERAHEAGDRSEFNVEQMAFFQSIQFLKMYCDHPDLVRMTESRIMEGLELKATRSSKLEELKFIVDEMVSSGNKVVVFTEFARAAELISREIPDVIVYRGGLSEREKKDRIDRFVDPGSGAMVLCSTDAGSHGLNLQEAASYLVNYDLPWNPSVLNQRIDRIHRIGQENTVNIINMVIVDDGVIEETIRKVLGRKQKLFDAVIEGTGG